MNLIDLQEARAKPELNPQLSAYEQLKQYKDDPSIYISFTSIDKLGIHPHAEDGGSPLGIYAFPLKDTWSRYKVDTYQDFSRYPDITHGKLHIQILKWSGKQKIINGLDKYTAAQLAKDIKHLKMVFDPKDVDNAVNEVQADFNDLLPFREIYYIARHLADTYPNQWNHILRYLGYSAIIDHGLSIIHYAEPCQALFLTKDATIHIGSVHSRSYGDASHLIEYDPRKMTTKEMVDIAIDNNTRIQKFEPYIMKDLKETIRYILEVLHYHPWPEAEKYIMVDPEAATTYVFSVLRKRWKIAEPAIQKGPKWDLYKHRYIDNV